jgi:phosphoesterase RecJ-like protein
MQGYTNIKKVVPNGCDLVISVDTATPKRISADTRDLEIIVIDHHLSNSGFGTINIIDSGSASTAEVVYRFIKENDLKINKPCAKTLYSAIVSDSRSFITPRVKASTFKTVSDLLECGADISETTQNLRYSMGLSEMRLFGEALRSFELVNNGRFAVCVISKEMLEKTGASYDDTEDIADFLLGNVTVEAICLLIERKMGQTKGSFRSKLDFDVLKLAKEFNGGGHINAAGFDTDLSTAKIKKQVIEVLSRA